MEQWLSLHRIRSTPGGWWLTKLIRRRRSLIWHQHCCKIEQKFLVDSRIKDTAVFKFIHIGLREFRSCWRRMSLRRLRNNFVRQTVIRPGPDSTLQSDIDIPHRAPCWDFNLGAYVTVSFRSPSPSIFSHPYKILILLQAIVGNIRSKYHRKYVWSPLGTNNPMCIGYSTSVNIQKIVWNKKPWEFHRGFEIAAREKHQSSEPPLNLQVAHHGYPVQARSYL